MPEPTDPTRRAKKEIVVEVHEGVAGPRVELSDGDQVSIKLRSPAARAETAGVADRGEPAADESMPVGEMMSISLESVDVEVENQSFGMITAITGCASNVGGPSC